MVKDLNSSARLTTDQNGKVIYEYLRHCAAIQPPEVVINEFSSLFIQGRNESNRAYQVLQKILSSPTRQQEFNQLLSNCFFLILDCWSQTPEAISSVSELIAIFDVIPQAKSYDRRRKQLFELIKNYQQDQIYFQLRAIISILNPQEKAKLELKSPEPANNNAEENNRSSSLTRNHYLGRYTYLYKYFLPANLEVFQLREYISNLETNRQQEFEIKLSKHIIYRFRLKQLARMKLLSKGAGKIITKVDNPSLLSERAFKIALQKYIGKLEIGSTLFNQSQRFIADNNLRNTYQVFKQDLHSFLTNNIQPRNNNYKFAKRLEKKLEQIFPQSNAKPLNNSLILQTSRQLFSFLIVDPFSSTDPTKFAELIINLGTVQVMMVLIKITLICPDSKADLERKIFLIVSYYQQNSIQVTPWLVKTLEHLLIAFSIYFGDIDVSIAKSIN